MRDAPCLRRPGDVLNGPMDITVRASASGRRQPELALLRVSVAHESGHRDEAVQQAGEVMASLVAALDDAEATHPGAITRRVVLPVHTRSWRPWNDQGTQLDPRHQATGRIEVEFADFDLLGRLVQQWALVDGVSFPSPEWRLTDATLRSLDAELTREAILEARGRAQVMAEASGFTTVVPVQVADIGLLGEAPTVQPQMMARAAKGAWAGDEALDLVPREIEPEVTVEARFRAE